MAGIYEQSNAGHLGKAQNQNRFTFLVVLFPGFLCLE